MIQTLTIIVFGSAAKIGYIEMAKDIFSRRGAVNAEVTCNLHRQYRFIDLSLRPLRLCEKTGF